MGYNQPELVLLAVTQAHAAPIRDLSLGDVVRDYLSAQGPITRVAPLQKSDLDGDGRPEAILDYCVNDIGPGDDNEGASNPANIDCHVAIFGETKRHWKIEDSAELGQGKIQKVQHGIIYVDRLDYADNDPLCCPTKHLYLKYSFINKGLVLLN